MKKHNRGFIVLCLLLFVTILSGCGTFSVRENISAPTGYTLTEVTPIQMVQGVSHVFNHTKSGATIIYVQNSDTNLSFNIAFSTPPEVSKGLNHILEHMILSSSKSYPGKEVFFGAVNTTLNTYMNAFTANSYTLFPFSTTNESQYVQLADYYLSSVFEPTLDENTFKREGWRYELPAAGSPLTINGIVYSEMKGANANILRAATDTARQQLFPDTVIKNDSGGSSETIPALTLEEIRSYHEKYFIPSNSIICVYGNLDIESFLSFLDKSWLSPYEKKGGRASIPLQKPFEKPRTHSAVFPVSAGTPVEKRSAVSKAYAVSGLGAEDLPAFLLYITIMNDPASPLMDALRKTSLADSYFLSINPATRQMQAEFMAQNIDPQSVPEFERIVLEAIKNSAERGFDKALFDSQKAAFYADGVLALENTGIGVDLITDMAMGDIVFNTKYAFATANYDVQKVTMKNLMDVAKKYFLNNTHCVLVTITPESGLTEKNQALEDLRLAKIKDSLSREALQTLVSQTKEFNQWLAEPDTAGEKSLAKLRVLKPENLENSLEAWNISDTQKDGIRYLHSSVPGSVEKTVLQINLSALTPEELHYAKLYAYLAGSLGTPHLSYQEVSNRLKLDTLGVSFSVEAAYTSYLREESYPVFSVSWLTESKNPVAAEKLVSTVLFQSILDKNQIKEHLASLKAGLEQSVQSNASSFAITRSSAAVHYPYALQEHLSGLPYITFIKALQTEFEKNPDTVISQLEAVREKALVSTDVIVMTAGKTETRPEKFLSFLKKGSGQISHSYEGLSVPAKREAVIIRGNVNYSATAQVIPYQLQMTYSIASDMLSNEYFTPKIRLEGGAYGGNSGVSPRIFIAYSYRDPHTDKTVDVFSKTANFSQKPTAENLEPYIISRYGNETAPLGLYTKATVNIINYLRGYTPQMRYDRIESLKKTGPEEVERAIRSLSPQNYSVFLTAEALKKSALQFDSIIDMSQ